ncbi:MAG TPA: VWA domain-containing protein [Candidatus Limnocylindrales bacterium]|jgi:Ca-activated chloride channel family protein|nr:VWA domain-containing protein [Candidatus Limnocylindrales bacterium]
MTFAHPYFLLLLLLLPALAWLKGRRGEPPAFVYSSVQLVRGILNITRTKSGGFLSALRWLALALLIIALAQPRLTKSETKVSASGVDIVVALDMSGSMISEDFEVRGGRVNRFEMARTVLKQFIDKRPNDRIGLVVFGSQAYIATPLTLDHDFLLQNIDRLQIGVIDENRTAIGSALSTAVNRLREVKSKSKIVILMTDGQNNSGKIAPLTAAEAAEALKVKVYTIGVGMRGMAPMPVFFGGRRVGTRPEPVDIDEDTLAKIANRTGGKYYRADNTARFQAIYSEIDKLEKTEKEIKKFALHRELFAWVITPGLSLLLLEILLRHTAWRRLP